MSKNHQTLNEKPSNILNYHQIKDISNTYSSTRETPDLSLYDTLATIARLTDNYHTFFTKRSKLIDNPGNYQVSEVKQALSSYESIICDNIKHIAPFAGKIHSSFSKIVLPVTQQIDWQALSNLDRAMIMYDGTYNNSSQIAKLFVLSNSTYNEFSHIKTTIENILKNDNHKPHQKEELTKNITAFVDMQLDTSKILRLCNEIKNSNIPHLKNYWDNQEKELSVDLSLSVTENRIVCLLAAAYIAESLHNLSAKTHAAILDKQYFPLNFEKDLIKLRNIVFHPERVQEHELLQQFLYPAITDVGNDLHKTVETFVNNSSLLIERCLAVREKQNFYMSRTREIDTDIIEELKALHPIDKEFIANFIPDKLKDIFKNKEKVNVAELLEEEGVITPNIPQKDWPIGQSFTVNTVEEFQTIQDINLDIEFIHSYNPATSNFSDLQIIYDRLIQDDNIDDREKQDIKEAFVKAQIYDEVFNCRLENNAKIDEIIALINELHITEESMQKVVSQQGITSFNNFSLLFNLAELKKKESEKSADDDNMVFNNFSFEDCLEDNDIKNEYTKIINVNNEKKTGKEKSQCEEIKQFLPKLISAIEKISMYSEDITQNAHNSSYDPIHDQAGVELFTVVARSMVRKLTQSNDLFVLLAKEQTGETKSEKGIKQTFFDALKELQFHRGHIAHLDQPEVNVQMSDGLEHAFLHLNGSRYNKFLNVGLNEILNKAENILDDCVYSSDEYSMSDDALNLEINEDDMIVAPQEDTVLNLAGNN